MTTIAIPPNSYLDPYFKAHREDTRFVLGPGLYNVQSGWHYDKDHDHCCMGPGCELIGAGSRETRINVDVEDAGVPDGAKQIESLTAGSRSGYCQSVTLRGFSLETPYDDKWADLGHIGIHTWSCQTVIEDVILYGIRGTRPDREGFGVLVNESGGWAGVSKTPAGGSRIENVDVTASGYVCGVYIGYPNPMETSIARNIRVGTCGYDVAHAAFGTNGGVLWSGLSNTGRWQRAIFCDTAGGEGTVISGSHLRAENVLVEFRGGTGIKWKDIVVTDSLLEVTPAKDRTYAAALVLARDGEKPGPEFDGVAIQNCTIRGGTGDHYVGSIDSAGKNNGVFYCRLTGSAWKSPVLAGGFNGMREFGTVRL